VNIERYWLILFCIALLPLACVNTRVQHTTVRPAEAEPAPSVTVFDCEDGQSVTVRFEHHTAVLTLAEKTLRLEQVPAASGARYSDGATTFWTQGDEAVLDLAGETEKTCTLQPQKTVWEKARMRGVDFRAVGNEPGWHMEISYGGRIVIVTDYGRHRQSFPAPAEPLDADAAQSTIHARTADHRLAVVIRNTPCRDSMSGENFESSVQVTLDGNTFDGCGRSLE